MLSSKLTWVPCALALLLVPAAMADGIGQVPPEDPSGQPPSLQDVGDELRPIVYEVRDESYALRDQVESEVQQAEGEAAAAQAEVERQVAELQQAVEALIGEAQAIVDDVKSDAERRVADITTFEEPASQEPTAVDYTPEAALITPLSLTEPLVIAGAAVATAALLFWLAGSTGLTGAGQAAGGSLAGKDLRKLLPYASPLFTRFERDTVLGHPKREALYAEIMTRPGITLQDLCGETGLSRTAVSHHLRLLEQQHLIVSKRVGRSRHFFENGGRYGRDQKDAYAILHNDRSKDVHAFIAKNPGAIQKDVCEALSIQASVAHWHVKRLEEARLIEAVRQGRTVSYFPTQSPGYA